jgi:hypothetical protein
VASEHRQLEQLAVDVQQTLDPLPHRQAPALKVPRDRFLRPT